MKEKIKYRSKESKRNHIIAELHTKHSDNAKEMHKEWIKAIHKLNRLIGTEISYELCIIINEK